MKNIFEYVACDLCGNNDVRFLFEKKETNPWWKRKCADDTRLDPNMEFTIVKCLNCNHVYVNPRLIPEINQDIYARYWRSHQPRTLEASEYANYVCRQLEKLGTKGRLLDFGCGWGAYLNEARKLGWEVIGIEVDAAKVKFCRENGINAVYGDLLDLNFEESSMNSVIAEQVFEHLYKPKQYLEAIRRVLCPNGILHLSVPNFGSLQAHIKGKEWKYIHPVSHVRYFDYHSLSSFLTRNGFVLLKPLHMKRFKTSVLRNILYSGKVFLEQAFQYYVYTLDIYAKVIK